MRQAESQRVLHFCRSHAVIKIITLLFKIIYFTTTTNHDLNYKYLMMGIFTFISLINLF